MRISVTAQDTSVSDSAPETRLYRLRLNPFSHSIPLSHASADLYSQICYQAEDLGAWLDVQAPIALVAQLKVAGLVDVRVEG